MLRPTVPRQWPSWSRSAELHADRARLGRMPVRSTEPFKVKPQGQGHLLGRGGPRGGGRVIPSHLSPHVSAMVRLPALARCRIE